MVNGDDGSARVIDAWRHGFYGYFGDLLETQDVIFFYKFGIGELKAGTLSKEEKKPMRSCVLFAMVLMVKVREAW